MGTGTEDGIVRVVAHFTDGRIIKGTTHDFAVEHPTFHLKVVGEPGPPVKVQLAALKAVFFVKTFEGKSERLDDKSFERAPNHGRRVRVRFKDGEEMAGITVSFAPGRPGFFVIPADAGGNNVRVYVLRSAVKSLEWVNSPTPSLTR